MRRTHAALQAKIHLQLRKPTLGELKKRKGM
jgi:hypothetical protein